MTWLVGHHAERERSVVGSLRALRGPDLSPGTIYNMHVLLNIERNEAPTEEIRVRGLTSKWDSGEGRVNHMILTYCSFVSDRNWKGQNTGGASAFTKGLVEQVEGLMGKFPSPSLCLVKYPGTESENRKCVSADLRDARSCMVNMIAWKTMSSRDQSWSCCYSNAHSTPWCTHIVVDDWTTDVDSISNNDRVFNGMW